MPILFRHYGPTTSLSSWVQLTVGRILLVILFALLVAGRALDCLAQDSGVADRLTGESVRVEESAKAILVKIGDRTVLRYHKSIQEPPAGVESVYCRSGYIHPIYTPAGLEVTGDFAPEHLHQHGLFFAWVNTRFEGRDLDFWNQKKQTGRVAHSRVLAVENENGKAEFEVELLHQDITETDRPKTILVEKWRVAVKPRMADCFVFDLVSSQTNVVDSPLELLEYRYGGLGVRGNEKWFRDAAKAAVNDWTKAQAEGNSSDPPGAEIVGHQMLTSEGKHKQSGNHTSANWVAMFGELDGKPAGIAIMSHPSNFRSPQPVRLHPVEPYFSYSPVVTGPFKIEPGQTYVSRYRVIAFDGELDKQLLQRVREEYESR